MDKELVKYLSDNAEQILRDSKSGDKTARDIVNFYTLYQACPDHIALTFLKIAVQDYKERNEPDNEQI